MPKTVSYEQALLLFSVQTAWGQAATLNGGTALLVENLKEQVGVSDEDKMNPVSDDPLYKPVRKTNLRNVFGFDILWNYSGAAGTPSVLEGVLNICGMNSLVEADKNVTYTRGNINDLPSATVKMIADIDGDKAYEYQGFNGRGQVGVTWEAAKVPRFNITNLLASYMPPSETTTITPDWKAQKTNIGESWEGEIGYDCHIVIDDTTHNLCLEKMNNDNIAAMTIAISPTAGCQAGAEATNAESMFSIKYKLPDFSSEFNPWSLDGKSIAISFGCGSEAGKRIKITCDSVEVSGETTREAGAGSNTFINQKFRCLTAAVIIEE